MSEIDQFDDALTVMRVVLAQIRERRSEPRGTGSVVCATCGGTVSYAFERHPGRSRPLDYSAQCETPNCVTFRGH